MKPSSSYRTLGVWGLAFLGVLAGCDRSEEPEATDVVPEGVPVPGTDAPVIPVTGSADAPLWRLSPEPVARLGLVEGELPYVFSDVAHAARLSGGELALFDYGSGEVRFFDRGGEFIKAVGGRGEGPGEFMAFTRVLRMDSDRMAVFDQNTAFPRITLVDRDDGVDLLHTITGFRLATTEGYDLHAALGPDRYVLSESRVPSLDHLSAGDTARPPVHVMIWNAETLEADTLLSVPGPLRTFVVHEGGPNRLIGGLMPAPLATETLVAGDGTSFVVSRTDQSQYQVFDENGRVERVLREVDVPGANVEDAVLTRWAQYVAGNPDEVTAVAPDPVSAMRDRLGQPLPTHSSILLDGNRLWVERFELPWNREAHREYVILDVRGQVLARLHVPRELRIHDLHDGYVTGVRLTEVHTPIVEVFRVLTR